MNSKHLITQIHSAECTGGEASTRAIRQTLGMYSRFWANRYPSASRRILVTMQEVANEINKMKSTSFRPLLVPRRVTFPIGDQLQKDARIWIAPPDPSKNHVIARRIHSGESAVWFTRGRTFKNWDLTGGLLWIHGKRACFSPHLIQPLMLVRGCSRIGEEHLMVSATYTSRPVEYD